MFSTFDLGGSNKFSVFSLGMKGTLAYIKLIHIINHFNITRWDRYINSSCCQMGKMLDDWQIGSGSAKLCLCRKEGRNLLLELCASVLAPSNVDDCHGLLLRLIV